jgi:lambda family phage holin
MPHNQVPLIFALWEALPEPIKAALLAGCVAFLRVMYDDREPRLVRRVLEAALCGAIAFGVGSGMEAMGATPGIATFIGGAIGLLGADKVRELGKRYVRRRIEEPTK